MVPAMRVRRPSVGKRVMARMPDSPPVSLAQLSVLPAPSDVITPRPVTTTVGRPCLSFDDGIVRPPSAGPFYQCEAFAPPMPDPGHHDLLQIAGHRLLQSGRVAGRKQTTMIEYDGRQRHVHDE